MALNRSLEELIVIARAMHWSEIMDLYVDMILLAVQDFLMSNNGKWRMTILAARAVEFLI